MSKQPTENQKLVFNRVVEKVKSGGKMGKISVSKEIRESGVYGKKVIKNPQLLTKSQGWQTLVNTFLSDELLSQTHHDLLKSTTLSHMTFPLGCETVEEKEAFYNKKREDAEKSGKEYKHVDILSDEEIKDLLLSVNCTVKKIVHGEQARYVYFWSADNRARKDGLDMAYKLKGNYAPEKKLTVVAHLDPKKKEKIDRILGIS